MSNWQRWPNAPLNGDFAGIEHPDRIVYPDLRDGTTFVLACDHSGEHASPEFRVLSFLLTTYKSVAEWDPLRVSVRKDHLPDGRRMSFKALNDALRINALSSFLCAASQLNGVLICFGVEKGFSLARQDFLPWQHDWTPDTLNKLFEICIFGGAMIDGLRGPGQNIHWISDDDSTVANDKAKNDAITLMGGLLHTYPGEYPDFDLSIASRFDDERRAEDLVSIPDLAAGAYSETLTKIGKANMPTFGTVSSDATEFLQIKSLLINAWRMDKDKPLKHMDAVIQSIDRGKMLVSFGAPSTRSLAPGESADGAPILNAKWRRALENALYGCDVDAIRVLRKMGIDGY